MRSMVPRAEDRTALLVLVPAALVVAAVTFNAFLAAVNAHVTGLTPAIVIAAEVLIVAAAHVVVLAHFRAAMAPWYALIVVMVVCAIVRSFGLGEIDIKSLRDVLLIPTFVLLGMTFDRRYLVHVVIVVQALVLAVLLLEGLATDGYSALFKVQDYYVNTRGYSQEDFWNKESDLYVSATRPDERFFGFIDLHRMSSLFLEPVSLGNYCIIVCGFICARYHALGPAARAFLIVGVLMALIGSDGRLAALSCIAIIVVTAVAPRLPANISLAYPFAVTAIAFALVWMAGWRAGSDDFPGRIAHTVELLQKYDVEEFLGISDRFLSVAVDSGLAYLITTQSLFGTMAIMALIILSSREDHAEQTRYTHAISLYLAFTMMVSFSLLTVKTAALLWFIHGSLQGASGLALGARPRAAPARRGGLVPSGA